MIKARRAPESPAPGPDRSTSRTDRAADEPRVDPRTESPRSPTSPPRSFARSSSPTPDTTSAPGAGEGEGAERAVAPPIASADLSTPSAEGRGGTVPPGTADHRGRQEFEQGEPPPHPRSANQTSHPDLRLSATPAEHTGQLDEPPQPRPEQAPSTPPDPAASPISAVSLPPPGAPSSQEREHRPEARAASTEGAGSRSPADEPPSQPPHAFEPQRHAPETSLSRAWTEAETPAGAAPGRADPSSAADTPGVPPSPAGQVQHLPVDVGRTLRAAMAVQPQTPSATMPEQTAGEENGSGPGDRHDTNDGSAPAGLVVLPMPRAPDAPTTPPPVHVHIDRIDVRDGNVDRPRRQREPLPAPSSTSSLDEYLEARRGGRVG